MSRAGLLAGLALLAAACTTTRAPIQPGDRSFWAGEERLRESAGRLATPPSADEGLFLQAEAFYHYRPRLHRGEGAGSYLTQAAAALSDFAPLTVLATSQGMFSLRMHAYDGAAQLYRTLAARQPPSPLRPLALYRLGWACRSTSREGFPCSTAAAFGELARDYPGSPLVPLAAAALREAPGKSLDRATLWSVLPGGGQIYAGETLNGTLRLGVSAGFGALALVPIVVQLRERKFGWLPTALSLVGIVGLQVTYTASYQDAQRAVLDLNEREEDAFRVAHPSAP